MLAAGWRGDTDDLDSELIVGFVARLKTIDLDVPRICGRLIDAGLRAARKARDADCDAQLIHIEATGPIAPIQPWDHPDLVLARAVAAAVIDADEANLISATRLDTATVAQVADTLGIAASTASAWRAKAEQRLAAAISAGELAFIPLRPRRRRANTATNVANGAAVGPLLGANSDGGVLLATQQQAFGGKTSDREAAGVGAPGIGTRPA
jgi:transposase-like protein